MQTSGFPRETELIPFLICCCLVTILAWNIFLTSSFVLWTLSNPKTPEGFTKNRSVSTQFPRDSQSIGNQLLAWNTVEYECNYAAFGQPVRVTTWVYESGLCVRGTATIDRDVGTSLPHEVFKDARKFLLTTSESNLRDSLEIGNALGTIHEAAIARGIEEEKQMEGFLNERSIDGITVKMNTNDAAEKPECETLEETNSAEQSIHRETSLKAADAFEDISAMHLSSCVKQLNRKCTGDEAALENVYKSVDKREEYAENANDHENGINVQTDDNDDDSRHKFGARSQIEEDGSEENTEEYYRNLETQTERQRPVEGATKSLMTDVSISTLQASKKCGESSKQSSEEINTLEVSSSPSALRPPENEPTEEENCGTSKGESQTALDRFEERLREDAEICSKEDDYLGEQFGMIPEKGANCTEEKSIMHSGKNTTQPQNEKEEKKLGLTPAVEPLKNSPDAETTITMVRSPSTNYTDEGQELNAMIRRMIAEEIKKHRKKEQASLKRAYSDTESTLSRNKYSRVGLLNPTDRTFLQYLLVMEENQRKDLEDKSDTESVDNRFDGIRIKRSNSAKQDVKPSGNDAEPCAIAAEATIDSKSGNATPQITNVAVSNISLERKLITPFLRNVEEGKPIDGKNLITIPKYASKSTQTEHAYVIRAVRSCPLRKRRLPGQMQLQLHRLPSDRESVCSQTVYLSPDFTKYIFRKASDNLIYEKGKGSHSPSYISSPQRFKWRYIKPKEVIENHC